MKLQAIASLGISLSRLSNRFGAGDVVARDAADAFDADAVVVWLPAQVGPCRAEDLFVGGQGVPRSSILDIAHAIRQGSLERWFSARGISVATVIPVGDGSGPFGLLALGWHSAPSGGDRTDAFLSMISEDLRAAVSRGDQAELAAAASAGAECLPIVVSLRQDVARLQQEVGRLKRLVPDDGDTSARQRTIIESTGDYVFVKDVWSRYVDVNVAYLRALGLSRDDVVGRRDGDLFPPDVAAETAAREQRTLVSGQPLDDETSLVLGGRRRHLLARRSPWRNTEGRTIGVVTVATDITDRKEAEVQRQAALEDLRAANDRTQSLLREQMRLSQRGSAILDLTRRLTAETEADAVYRIVLEAAERQLDDARAVLLNGDPAGPTFSVRCRGARADGLRQLRTLNDFVAAGFGSEVVGGQSATCTLLDPRASLDALLIADGMRAVTVMPVAAAGRPQPVLLVAWPDVRECSREDLWFIENLGVQLGLALKNARLYSDLKQSLLSLQEAQREMLRTQRLRALGDMASGIAHQFNNSLTSILGLADWLLFTLPADAPGRAEIGTIRDAATETAALVKRLRGFGRVSSGGDASELVDPAEVLRQVPDLVRERMDAQGHLSGVRHDIVLEVGPVPLVRCAPSELREILLHLASNAIDAMPDGGRISLRSAESDGRVRLSVTDEGDGVPAGIREHLFDPFFTTRGDDHVGLGLSVCRSIAERYGATVEIDASREGGTTVTVVLPVPAPLPGLTPDVEPAGAMAEEDSEGTRVLLVDDQQDILDAVSEMISALGHRVDTALGGAAALERLAERHYDLLLTDLGMPGMDGRELARRAVAARPGLRAALFTGWSIDAEGERPEGISAILSKPVTMHALRSLLDQPASA
jgi:PAS domain S-box-containing protein